MGGRQRVFTHAQELAVVNLVVANNTITLRQLRERILEDQAIFHNVHSVSTTTLARVLREHHVSMKQLYKVPFERNSVAVKNLRYDYVQVSATVPLQWQLCVYMDIYLAVAPLPLHCKKKKKILTVKILFHWQKGHIYLVFM